MFPAEDLTRHAALRRALLQRAAAAGGVALLGSGMSLADAAADPLVARCRDLYIYGLAALEMARARDRTMGPRANQFRHVRALASAASRRVTTPNNDTLYSSAWLDLRQGPVELAIPATADRYFSLALLDMHSNNFHIVGTRVTGGQAHRFRLLPPDATPGPGDVRAPTWWVWAQARTLVAAAADVSAAHAVQDQLLIEGSSAAGVGSPPPESPMPAPPATAPEVVQLAAIARLLDTDAPGTTADRKLLRGLREGGLTAAALAAAATSPSPAGEAARLVAAAIEGVAAARRAIASILDHPKVIDGWLYSQPSIGDFGTDYLYRASIAVWGLAALPQVEAMYFRAFSPATGATFDGRENWRIRFAAGRLPPVGAFWSLSLYEVVPDGGLFFFDSPSRRFSIGDRTPGLARGDDGSLEIRISADEPGLAWRGNWLPCPRGPFALILRAYLPGRPLVDGTYRLPPVERT